jgi:hypothetical protein
MTAPIRTPSDDSATDDLLHQLSQYFLLDQPVAGRLLGDLLAEGEIQVPSRFSNTRSQTESESWLRFIP